MKLEEIAEKIDLWRIVFISVYLGLTLAAIIITKEMMRDEKEQKIVEKHLKKEKTNGDNAILRKYVRKSADSDREGSSA